MGKIKDKNRAVISFDDAKRKDFLTGFRKRKKERKDYAQRKEQEELKKQQREDRQEERKWRRAAKLGVGVDDLADIDAQITRALDGDRDEDLAPPGADVTTYEDDGTLTTAVVTPMFDDDSEEPPLWQGATISRGSSSSVVPSGRRPKLADKKKLPRLKTDQKKKSQKSKDKNRIISKKERARIRAPTAPKSNIIARAGGMKGQSRGR